MLKHNILYNNYIFSIKIAFNIGFEISPPKVQKSFK